MADRRRGWEVRLDRLHEFLKEGTTTTGERP